MCKAKGKTKIFESFFIVIKVCCAPQQSGKTGAVSLGVAVFKYCPAKFPRPQRNSLAPRFPAQWQVYNLQNVENL